MNNNIIKKYLLIALLSTGLSISSLSNAAVNSNNTQTETMKITVSDLDLSQHQGVVTLYNRLKNSAGKVCGSRGDHVTGSRIASSKIKRQFKRCYARALNGAVQSIANDRLTDFHSNNS